MNRQERTEAEIENAITHLLKAGLSSSNISLCFDKTVAEINLIGSRHGIITLKRGRPVEKYPELSDEQKRIAFALYATGQHDIIRIREILGEDVNINSIFDFLVTSDYGFGLVRCDCGRVLFYVEVEREYCDLCLGISRKPTQEEAQSHDIDHPDSGEGTNCENTKKEANQKKRRHYVVSASRYAEMMCKKTMRG